MNIQPKKKISVVFAQSKNPENMRLAKISRQMGNFEIEHHFAKGRGVAVLEGRKIVMLYKDGTKKVIGECASAS